MSKRRLASFLDAFEEYTANFPSPALWRKWAGITCMAMAMERKVYFRTGMGDTFPTLYTFLIGPPASGKTLLTGEVSRLLLSLKTHHIAPSSVSRASLMDELRNANRVFINKGHATSFNSLQIVSNELAVLIPGYENDFMNTLTDIYDGKRYSESKRSKDLKYVIEAPQLNILAATNPVYMNSVMPEGAWDQGFISRVIMAYSGESRIVPIFSSVKKMDNLFNDLAHDLNIIGSLFAKYEWAEDAAAAIETWHSKGGPPRPDHPRLENYCGRRTLHVLKLSLIAAVDESDEPVIQLRHFQRALDWLIEVEVTMPEIFKAYASGGDGKAIEDVWYYAYKYQIKNKHPITEARLMMFLQQRVPSIYIDKIIASMVGAELLKIVLDPKLGKCYQALERDTV